MGIWANPRSGYDRFRIQARTIWEEAVDSAGKFVPIGEVSADERSRIAVGKAGVRRDDRYAVAVNDDGEILLTPLVSIPKRELLVWENAQIREALSLGLLQSAAGETTSLGDFSQYATDDDEDDE
jgi:hypothetical protein